ncbi:MAG: oligogalacturonate lyase [Verrucomicrobia bacterium]|nr:oligogalacturonate lyase [Verrucomicrobiota bacterium]
MRSSNPCLLALHLIPVLAFAADEPPKEWIEPETGHRVVRLSREPGSASLYFHQHAYSTDGKKLVITTPGGLSTVNLHTREIEQVVKGRVGVLVTGRKTGNIYYIRDGAVHATDLDTKATREVAKIPPDVGRGGTLAINADETLLVGIASDPVGQPQPRTPPPGNSGGRLESRWAAGTPMVLYTIHIASGEVKKIYREHDWTNHLQCSPTDPSLIMFCHEGPWHYLDRIWTIRSDGTGLRLIHKRTMDMEIAGHEFFSADGRTIWYDLQTPKSGVFWLAGVDLATGARTQYHLERREWSVHFNISPDGKLFAGDGGGPNSVANRSPDGQRLDPPGNGQWIYLFRPVAVRNPAGVFPEQKDLIKTGYLKSERLVDLSKHNYQLEPNVTFTPDARWIVFRSNMHGATHVYAVEVEKANPTTRSE